MTECEFSVVKYVPNIARFEPVNIGVALLDKKNKQMHNKYITNFNEFFKRLGVDKIHGLEKSFENYKPRLDVGNDDYLWKLHESFHGSIFYSEPIKVNAREIDITLQQVFNKMISIPEREEMLKDITSVTKMKNKIKKYVEKLKFPENTCKEKFSIETVVGIPQTRDFAFVKDGELLSTVDVFNLTYGNIFDSLKLFFYEIQAIISSEQHSHTKSWIFSTSTIEEKAPTEQLTKFINTHKIPVIEPESQEGKLAEIRASVV